MWYVGFSPKLPKTLAVVALCLVAAFGAACRKSSDGEALSKVIQHHSRKTLTAFASEAELSRFLADMAKAQKTQAQAQQPGGYGGVEAAGAPAQAAPPSAEPGTASDSSGKSQESVTNTQHAGVDEGGIVKLQR